MIDNKIKEQIMKDISDIRYDAHQFFIKSSPTVRSENFLSECIIKALFDYLDRNQLTIERIYNDKV